MTSSRGVTQDLSGSEARPGRRLRRAVGVVVTVVGVVCAVAITPAAGRPTAQAAPQPPAPIQHVVVLLQENHSFDNTLGRLCADIANGRIRRPGAGSRCDGTTVGDSAGATVPLTNATDIVANSLHDVQSQLRDIAGGVMDGFKYPSDYTQYDPLSGPCTAGSCIPNLSALATRYTVSDRTFELNTSPSFEGHLVFAAATQDGFYGDNPKWYSTGPQPINRGQGWGCDSGKTTYWSTLKVLVPSCIPGASGSLGPNWANYTGPHPASVPTIFDELTAAHQSWRIYGGQPASRSSQSWNAGYQWAICPSFAECEYTSQRDNLRPIDNVISDAANGTLPSFSIVTPTAANSQHNDDSMSTGDNWIGTVISAIQNSRDWSSTAVIITYDDCGCFYDHVNPLEFGATWGVRVPLVIVSPFARLGYTDSTPTTFAGILALVEHNFGLAALNSSDADAYDYSNAFCFGRSNGCTPAGTAKVAVIRQGVASLTPAQLKAQIAAGEDDT